MYRVISCTVAVLALCLTGKPAAADDAATCEKGTGDDRIAACTRVLKRSPNDASAYYNRGVAHFYKGEYDRAIADFSQQIKLEPTQPGPYSNRGNAYRAKGEYDRAIADHDQAIGIDPKFDKAYNNRGNVYREKGEYGRAIADYDQALKLNPSYPEARQSRELAQAALDEATCGKDGDDKIAACTRVLKRNPKSAVAYGNRGEAHRINSDYDRAIADYDQAIQLDPKSTFAYIGRGLANHGKANFDRAIADYDQTIRLDPKNAFAYILRGAAYEEKGQYDRASAEFDQAIRLEPNSAMAYNGRADAYNYRGEYDRALADLDQAIRLDPNYADAFTTRGESYSGKREYDRAIADFDHAISINPKQADPYSHRGFAYAKKGDFDRAMADLDKAIAVNPKFAIGYNNRAAVYELRGQYDLAIADYDQSLRLNPALPKTREGRDRAQAALAARREPAKPVAAIPPPALTPQIEASLPAAPPAAAAPPRAEPAAPPQRRVALIIGNSEYRAVAALPNPRRDAQAVADALRQSGFQAVELATDLDRDGMVKALRAFRSQADRADWALVYFAGHGIEIDRVNYLIPVDANLADDRDVKTESVSYEELLSAVGGARMLRLVVLDACRNNPFKERMRRTAASRGSLARGLAPPPETEPGTLVVYSAKEGEVAEDDVNGVNSPFAHAFVEQLKVPGLEVRRVFDNVRDDVIEATRRRQQPFTYGSLPGRRDFFFVSGQ